MPRLFIKKLKITRFYFNRILLFLGELAKLFMSCSKLMLKSRPTASTHKSLKRVSDIVLRVVVFISLILLNVLSQVVDETGIVMVAMIRNGKRNFKHGKFQHGMLSTEISVQEN
jgi:hypothetical protein